MVNNKFWWGCNKCNRKIRSPHRYKDLFLCHVCYNEATVRINHNLIYGEKTTKKYVFAIMLTETQNKRMLEKINKLFGSNNRKISPYFRELLLKDLKDDD